jgi:glycosidase
VTKKLLICLLALILTSEILFSQKITDLIPAVNLIRGELKKIEISDLFYAVNYNLSFIPHKEIKAEFNQEKGLLKLQSDNFTGCSLIEFIYDSFNYSIPVIVTNQKKVTFSIKWGKESKLFLFGCFNNWNREQYPLTYNNENGHFEISIPLDYGNHEYKFLIDGVELIDPGNPDKIPNGLGGENSLLSIKKPSAELYIHLIDFDKLENNSEIRFYMETINCTVNIDETDILALINNSAVDGATIVKSGNYFLIILPNDLFTNDNYLRVTLSNEQLISNTQCIRLAKNSGESNSTNFSWYDGTIYSIMIDRFFDGDNNNNAPVVHDSIFAKANYMGGDLEGIVKKIHEGYFDSLGVDIIWLSPVYDNPDEAFKEFSSPRRWYSGYHGYWSVSATGVEPKFGTMDKLKELIEIAHKHNIKILLDFVSNHVHEQHPFYKDHPEWFGKLELPDGRLNLRYWDEFRLTTWFEPYMPSFDYVNSEEALNVMVENAVWWLNETGADGFRHDAVKHVPNIFWRTLTQKIKNEFSVSRDLSVYQIGETFGDYDLVSSYVNNGQLDAQFNFNLYNVAQTVFIDSSASFQLLDEELNKTFSIYGILHKMGNIMDSHDKNRYMSYADGDLTLDQWSAGEIGWSNPPVVDNPYSYKKAELYYAYMFTIPGLPVIYYGSEFGMTGASDPDNRRMMRFDGDLNEHETSMLQAVRKISSIRNSHTALRYGDYYTLKADKNIFAYIRSDIHERILVVLNKSDEEIGVEINPPQFYNITSANDIESNKSITLDANVLKLTLAPSGWKIIQLLPGK